jgi:HPt (histidine-containing phosphotransfer) domain-containing protein
MVYDPGALNASLAAAVGNDSMLMAELRADFMESAQRQADLMSRSRCDANWQFAASRLTSLAASFGAVGLMELAEEALRGAPGDPVVLRKLRAAIDDFGSR